MTARKHSKKRDAILDCIRSTRSHPTADWVYAQLKPEIPDLSLGTVYRNLATFKAEGVIASVGTVDGMERYDWRTFPHPHFVCTHCNAVLDVDEIDPPQELAAKVTCGSVRDCVLTFYGICNQCVRVDAQNISNQIMEEQ